MITLALGDTASDVKTTPIILLLSSLNNSRNPLVFI